MNNKGLYNHFKYRTKYWQEKQNQQLAQKSSKERISNTVITGRHISKPSLIGPDSSRKLQTQHFMLKGVAEKSRQPSKSLDISHKHYKWRLKKQLIDLDDDTISTVRQPDRYNNVRSSMDQRSYLGKSFLEKQNGKRPGTSITLELAPGSQEYRIEHRFSSIERKHQAQFLPLHSSRYKATYSPIF